MKELQTSGSSQQRKMWPAVHRRSPWCLLLTAFIIAGFLSAEQCNGQLPGVTESVTTLESRKSHGSWSKLGEILVLSKLDDGREISYSREELVGRLKRDFRKMLSFPTAVSAGVNISQQCLEDSIFYVENLFFNQAIWALQMLESSAELPAGIIGNENYHAEGLFDECQAARSVPDRFGGQYCTVFFKTSQINPLEIVDDDPGVLYPEELDTLRRLLGSPVMDNAVRVKPKLLDNDPWALYHNYPSMSLCLPSSCSASDLGQSVANLIGQFAIANQSIVTISDEQFCFAQDRYPRSFDGLDIAALLTLGLLGCAVLLATVHEAWLMHRGVGFVPETGSRLRDILHCFSALSNGRKLLSLSGGSDSSSGNLSCLNGIRFVTTFWLICVHTLIRVVGMAKSNVANPKLVEQDAMDWKKQILVNSSVSVDSFFMMSGLLVSYLLLRELDRTAGRLRLGLLYLHRYLRLTPVYAVILFFVATLMVYIGTGPEWYYIVSGSKACRENWWQHLLYINNFFPFKPENMCMFETWYMAVDTQLFIIAPLFVYLLWRWEKTGLATLTVFTLSSLAANVAVFTFNDNFPPTIMPTRWLELKETFTSYVDSYYMKSWARAPPYMVGLWTGWILHRAKDSRLLLPQWLVASLWALSLAACSLIIYGLSPYVDEKTTPTIDWAVRMIYGSFHRVIWALALAWIIVACVHGYGGFLDRFLSWNGFRPFSRLSYCIYLIHFEYMHLYYALKTRKIYGKFFDLLTMFFGISVIVFILAFILSVFVEAPFINLEKLIFSSQSQIPKKTKELEKAGGAIQSAEEANRINNNIDSGDSSLKKRRTYNRE